jgi:lipopolysaccharide exporter
MDVSESSASGSAPVSPPQGGNSFGSDVLKLISGTTAAQALIVAATPILTRLYGPAAFGGLAVFVSITSTLTVVASLKYETAIMLPHENEEAASVLATSIGIAGLVSVLSIPLVWLCKPLLVGLLQDPKAAPFLWLIPPTIFMGGVGLGHPALNYWAARTGQYGQMARSRVVGAIIGTASQLGMGFLGLATTGMLVTTNVLGSFSSVLLLGRGIWRNDARLLRDSVTLGRIKQAISRYRKFPLLSSWAALLNILSWQAPSIILAVFFASDVVGFFALGQRALRTPLSLVGGAISQVFFQRSSQAIQDDALSTLVGNVFQRLVALGLFPMLVMTFVGKDICTIVFGGEWAEAGVYMQILSLWTFVWFVSSPLSTIFSSLERQEFDLGLNALIFSTRIASLAIGAYLHSPRTAVILFAGSGIVVYGYLGIKILHVSGLGWRQVRGVLFKHLSIFAPVGAILFALQSLKASVLIIVGFSVTAVLVYEVLTVVSDHRLRRALLRFIRQGLNGITPNLSGETG